MVKPVAVPSEPILTGSVRKTLLQQQSEVTVKDPSTHAARQVRRFVHEQSIYYCAIPYLEINKIRATEISLSREVDDYHLDPAPVWNVFVICNFKL